MYARQKGLKLKETIYGLPGNILRRDKEDFARGVKSDVGLGKMFKDTGSFLDWQIKPSRIIETLLAMKLKRPRFNVVARNDSLAWGALYGAYIVKKNKEEVSGKKFAMVNFSSVRLGVCVIEVLAEDMNEDSIITNQPLTDMRFNEEELKRLLTFQLMEKRSLSACPNRMGCRL